MTNYELIKCIEEMAVTISCPKTCEMGMVEIECDKSDLCDCAECCLEWLNQESEGV